MSTPGSWVGGVTGGIAEQARVAAQRALVISVVIAFLTGIVSLSLYFDNKKLLNQTTGLRPEVVASVDGSLLRIGLVAMVAALGSLAALLAASKTWQRQFIDAVAERDSQHKTETASLQNQLTESRRAREHAQMAQSRLEEKVRSLTTLQHELQEKLDKRDRVERALAAKRQELEVSRNVLELHVHARTQELQKLQRRYEMILNAAGEGICGFDAEGRMTFANPAVTRITGWAPEEIAGKTEPEILWTDAQPADYVVHNRDNFGECVFRRKDDSRFPVEFVRTPIREADTVVGFVLVFKDITERKQVEETLSQKAAELARSNSELEQFAFVASHDLQEPLRKIQAFGDRLRTKCEKVLDAEPLDYLERMQTASARMRNLIDDLLAFSRVIRSSEPFVQVELGSVVKEVLLDLEVRIEKSGGRVDLGEMPSLHADPMQMRQLFLNLISNALKFQPPGNTPVVKLVSRTFANPSGRQMCEIQVQDNGIGFDEKYTDRIFAVFQRLHGRSQYEGTGIGLAVCRRIVDRHSGSIVARSKPGEGATFVITLPMVQTRTEVAA